MEMCEGKRIELRKREKLGYLKEGMRAVGREAVRANAEATAQAEDILVVLPAGIVDQTWTKERVRD